MDAKPVVFDDIGTEIQIEIRAVRVITRRMLRRSFRSRVLAISSFLLAILLLVIIFVSLSTDWRLVVAWWQLSGGILTIQIVILIIVYLMRRQNEIDGSIVSGMVNRMEEEAGIRAHSKN